MKNKSLFLLLPLTLLPYTVVAAFMIIAFAPNIMQNIFKGNPINLIITLSAYILLALLMLIGFIVTHIISKTDSKWLALVAMAVKLIQIPAYVFIFICGVLCLITIFTLPFVAVYFILDYITLIFTGSLVGVALFNSAIQKRLAPHQVIIHILAQFVFCLDIVSAIALFIKLAKGNPISLG